MRYGINEENFLPLLNNNKNREKYNGFGGEKNE